MRLISKKGWILKVRFNMGEVQAWSRLVGIFHRLGLVRAWPLKLELALGSKKWARSISTRACDVNDRSQLWSSASAQKIFPLNFNWASLGRKKHSDKKLTLLSNYCWRLCLRGLFLGGGAAFFSKQDRSQPSCERVSVRTKVSFRGCCYQQIPDSVLENRSLARLEPQLPRTSHMCLRRPCHCANL